MLITYFGFLKLSFLVYQNDKMFRKIIIIFLFLQKGFLLAQEENPFELYKAKWIGKPIPELVLKDIYGKEIKTTDLKGKVFLLNMWFIGCPGCKVEYPGLQTLKKRFVDAKKVDKVEFFSLALDTKENLVDFLKKNPLDFIQIPNTESISRVKFNVLGFPTNIIVDKNGIIRHIKIGGSAQSADDIEYEMLQLLK